MLERFAHNIDKYLRREDSFVAKGFKVLSPEVGESYRSDLPAKRISEVSLALPAAIASLPIVGILALSAKLEDGGSAFFVHRRIGRNGKPLKIVKIRCMQVDAEASENEVIRDPISEPEKDPRCTNLGRFMRKFELEELPQLWQVLKGELSLVGIRAVPQNVVDYTNRESPQLSANWREAYQSAKPGLFSLSAAANPQRKNDLRRLRYDLLYSRKKGLGLDFYIVTRATTRLLSKVFR